MGADRSAARVAISRSRNTRTCKKAPNGRRTRRGVTLFTKRRIVLWH
ncbi:MAG: hypothetical protein OJF60_000485 [Burkholderiaceae bacterium]|nr:MAG: hypothetical protein OJF60_000485 [Burkholderiaceae bacterium]